MNINKPPLQVSTFSSGPVSTSLCVQVFHFLTWHVVHMRKVVLQEANHAIFLHEAISCMYVCNVRQNKCVYIRFHFLTYYLYSMCF